MTREQIIARFPKASESFVRANLSAGFADPIAKLESDTRNAPLAKEKVQRSTSARVLVCVTSIRRRLIDQDNLCEKYIVDLLRYSRVIPDDSPDQCAIEVSQQKAIKGQPEQIVIEVYEQGSALASNNTKP